MGKSNGLNISHKITDKEIHNILSIDEIKYLDKINKKFIEKIIIYFSQFIKHDIKVNFFTIKINSYTNNEKDIKYLFSNKIEILNSNKKLFIFFSDNLLYVFIDLLFGGNGTCTEKIDHTRQLTYTEEMISKKVLKLICSVYCTFFEKIFSININTYNIKIFNIEKDNCLEDNYITSYFNLSLNGICIFFSILLPISIFKKYCKQINSSQNHKKSLIKNINFKKNIPIINIYDIELDVVIQLITPDKRQYKNLSIGDILIVNRPDKVIACIKKIPTFLGYYKNFNKKSVVFFKKFINKNIDISKYEEFFNE